jgi:hypothetical protein
VGAALLWCEKYLDVVLMLCRVSMLGHGLLFAYALSAWHHVLLSSVATCTKSAANPSACRVFSSCKLTHLPAAAAAAAAAA